MTALPASRARFLDELDAFSGTIVRGDESLDHALLSSSRVGIVGTASDVAPRLGQLARHSASVDVFLVEPAWVLPRLGPLARHTVRLSSATVPRSARRRLTRTLAEVNLNSAVRDEWTRRQLTPRHGPGRGNIVYSNRFYRSLRRRNVRLITWPVAGVCAGGLRTADGIERHVDVLVIS